MRLVARRMTAAAISEDSTMPRSPPTAAIPPCRTAAIGEKIVWTVGPVNYPGAHTETPAMLVSAAQAAIDAAIATLRATPDTDLMQARSVGRAAAWLLDGMERLAAGPS